jgi:hypothetical protein
MWSSRTLSTIATTTSGMNPARYGIDVECTTLGIGKGGTPIELFEGAEAVPATSASLMPISGVAQRELVQ